MDEFNPKSEYRRGAPATGGYRELILELAGCAEDEAGGVERVMRDRWHTLDGLSRAEFRREARKALKTLRRIWATPAGVF